MKADQPTWLVLAPSLFLALWSTGYVAAKFGLGFAEPMTFLALRFGCVVVLMTVLFVILHPPLPKTLADWVHLVVVGFLLQSLYFGMCYLAFESGMAVGTLALILSLQPILVGLVAPRWAGERVRLQQWTGLVMGLLGAGIVIVARSEIVVPTATSFLFAFLALFGITAGTLWEKRFGVAHHPVTSNLIGYAAGFIGVLPFMFLLETMQVNWTLAFTISLAYLVVGTSLIAVGLLLAMIRVGEVSRVSALFYLVPPFAAVIAWIVLDEIMPPLAWAGMGLAVAGVFIATHKPKARATAL